MHSSVGILTFDSDDFYASAIKLPHPANIVVEERRTEAANSETSALSTFAPEIRPPSLMRYQSSGGKLLGCLIGGTLIPKTCKKHRKKMCPTSLLVR